MKNLECIMGVDPGVSGAIAFYFPEHPERVAIYDMPSIGKEINAPHLTEIIHQYMPDIAFIELVHAMPKQGVSSSFNFGMSYGMMRGVVAACGVPQQLVAPNKWKKHFNLNADKEMSRRLAILTWPDANKFNRKKDDGRAEAALLALYGSMMMK